MTITLARKAGGTSAAAAVQTQASASYTHTASSLAFTSAWSLNSFHATAINMGITNTGGLTYTRQIQPTSVQYQGGPNSDCTCALFTATVGASPSAEVDTLDPYPASALTGIMGLDCCDAVGSVGTVQIRTVSATLQIAANQVAKSGGNTETLTSATLPNTPLTSSTIVCIFPVGHEAGSPALPATPAGWTLLGSPPTPKIPVFATFYITGSTVTSVACSDLGNSVWTGGSIIFELEEAAAAGSAFDGPLIIGQDATTVRSYYI